MKEKMYKKAKPKTKPVKLQQSTNQTRLEKKALVNIADGGSARELSRWDSGISSASSWPDGGGGCGVGGASDPEDVPPLGWK